MMVDMSFRIKVAFDECTSSVVPRRLSLVEHGALGVVGRFRGFMTRFRRNVDGSLSWTWKHEFVNTSWPMLKAWLYLVLPVKASLVYMLWPDIIKLKMLMINLHQLPFCCWCTYIDMDTVHFCDYISVIISLITITILITGFIFSRVNIKNCHYLKARFAPVFYSYLKAAKSSDWVVCNMYWLTFLSNSRIASEIFDTFTSFKCFFLPFSFSRWFCWPISDGLCSHSEQFSSWVKL